MNIMNQKIANIFDVFHDGTIEAFTGNMSMLELKIGCTC